MKAIHSSNRFWLRALCLCVVLCMLIGVLPATAIAASTPSELYLRPNSNWTQANARFAAYFFGNGEKWVSGTALGNGLYVFAVPEGYPNVIFCRMNPNSSDNNWNNKWNQTGDLTIPTDGKNCYTINAGQWDSGSNGSWSVYDPLSTNIYLPGSFNGWNTTANEFKLDAQSSGMGYISIDLEANTKYEFKVIRNDSWMGCNTTITGTVSGLRFSTSASNNCKITTKVAGTYVFSIDVASLTLGVVYPCEHAWVAATCLAPKTCSICGETEGTIGDHSWKDANCTSAKTCSVCNETVGDALGHEYKAETTTVPGCNAAGVVTYTCERCGDSYTESVESTGHNHVAGTPVPPTCTEQGYTTYTCPCGDSYDADFVDPTGHTEETVPGTAAGCVDTGLTDGVKCSACGEVLSAQQEIPALGHKYSAVTTDPTCTADGNTTYTCDACGDTYSDVILALGHNYADGACTVCGAKSHIKVYFQNNWLWTDVKLHYWGSAIGTNPEWTGFSMEYTGFDGTYDYYVLNVPIDIVGIVINGIKNDGSGALDQSPDINSGWYDGICYYMHWEDGNRSGSFNISDVTFVCKHVEEVVPGTNADCVNDGLTDGTKCSVCGETLVAQGPIPALGHKYNAVTTTAPGCDSAGVLTYTCEQCGDSYTESLAATGHNYVAGTPVAPTCTEQGYTTYTCPCGDSYDADFVDATGHTEETVPGADADCINSGLTEGVKCSVCGEILVAQEPIPALGHNYDAVVTAPTCTEDGFTTYTCASCSDSYVADEVAALGHTEEIVPGYQATCTDPGLTDGFKCSACGETIAAQEEIPAINHKNGEYVSDLGENHGIYCADCDELLRTEDHEYSDELFRCLCGAAYNGIYTTATGDIYYVENAEAVANKGLVKCVDENGHIHYYYFGCGNEACSLGDACAGEYKAQRGIHHYAKITNGYLIECGYDFGDDGVIVHIDDTSANGICELEGVKYCLIDGIKVYMGLFEVNGKYYYARSSGALVVNRTYWVSKTNDLKPAGNYTFDETGAIVFPDEKNGISPENGGLFYYRNNARYYAGLIEIDGDYYYVRSNGQLVTDRTYWITKTNDLKPAATYYFDADGKLNNKHGFVEENGGIYYYVAGKLSYAGLIQVGGDYYYVRSNGQLVTDKTYWTTKTNDLLPADNYYFDNEGKLCNKHGFVEENGGIYYYESNKLIYAGLICVDGDYYYVRSNGQLVTDRIYWVTKTNDLFPASSYYFGEDGKMLLA